MKPQVLLAYEALIRNISQGYMAQEEILASYYKYRSGFTGERILDYKLNLLPNYYEQISDIRLKGRKQTKFQMDKIVLTSRVIIERPKNRTSVVAAATTEVRFPL